MKKLLLLTLIALLSISCKDEKVIAQFQEPQHIVIDTITNIKIVKSIKEVNETSTSYKYKYDWVNSKFRQQPKVESNIKYYIIYTDGTNEETTREKGMFYEKGDTIKSYTYKYN